MDIYNLVCPWESASFLVYSSNVPSLLYYSHVPAIVASLVLGFLVFWNNKKSLTGKLLLSVAVAFGVWAFFDLILWATNRTDITMFFWSLQILFEFFVFLLSFYLVYTYINNKFPSFKVNLIIFLATVPFILLISTKYNLLGVDLSDCYAIESDIIVYYSYILEILFTVLSILVIVFGYKHNITRRKEIIIFLVGIALFLLAFSFGNIVGSFTEDWVTAQYGLFGMPIFMGFLSYLIVKFHTFNVKLIAAQALVWGMVLLIGSQFFFIRNPINRVLNGVTFISVIIFGYFLVKSVKIEIEQKEQLAKLNIDLQNVIKQRESLVHLITHKVKGSFTRTKFIFAGLLDGTFGEVSPEVKKIATQGLEFDNGGIQTVDLVLNVANLQNGLIKYDMKNIDFKDVVLKTVEDKKVGAEAKGLKIETDIKDGSYQVNGDSFWLKEVVNNLIENSIKYTKEGVIKVGLGVKGKNALLSIVDTGLGITEEDKKNLFTEGGRGKDSVKVNVDSTGYGLFTVKMVVQEHKGRVWAESEGAGKGSQLYVELPVI